MINSMLNQYLYLVAIPINLSSTDLVSLVSNLKPFYTLSPSTSLNFLNLQVCIIIIFNNCNIRIMTVKRYV